MVILLIDQNLCGDDLLRFFLYKALCRLFGRPYAALCEFPLNVFVPPYYLGEEVAKFSAGGNCIIFMRFIEVLHPSLCAFSFLCPFTREQKQWCHILISRRYKCQVEHFWRSMKYQILSSAYWMSARKRKSGGMVGKKTMQRKTFFCFLLAMIWVRCFSMGLVHILMHRSQQLSWKECKEKTEYSGNWTVSHRLTVCVTNKIFWCWYKRRHQQKKSSLRPLSSSTGCYLTCLFLSVITNSSLSLLLSISFYPLVSSPILLNYAKLFLMLLHIAEAIQYKCVYTELGPDWAETKLRPERCPLNPLCGKKNKQLINSE